MKVGPYTVEPTGEVIERSIDGGNWHVYGCEITLRDGTLIMGTIQGDGSGYAPETLTDENGNPLP